MDNNVLGDITLRILISFDYLLSDFISLPHPFKMVWLCRWYTFVGWEGVMGWNVFIVFSVSSASFLIFGNKPCVLFTIIYTKRINIF